jgi:hypothetical protein
VDGRRPVSQLELRHDGDAGQRQQLRQRGSGRRLHRIARLDAGEDEVGALRPHDLGERAGHGDGVGSRQLVRPDTHAPVGPHGEGTAHRLLGLLGPDGDDDHLAVAGGLAHAQGLLRRERVPLVERVVEVVGIDVPLVLGELDLVSEGRDLLDADDDLHRTTTTVRPRPPPARSPAARA